MGLPAAGVPMKASMINAESAEVTTSNGKLAGTGGGTTPSAGSFVIRFDDATPSPVDQNKPYAYSDFYGKIFTPPVITCSQGSIGAGFTGGGNGNGYFEADISFTSGSTNLTGAIVVHFYVASFPDGIAFTYDGVTYTTLTSNVDGVQKIMGGTTGELNYVGSTSYQTDLINGSAANTPPGWTLTKSVWNGTTFGATGNNETGLITNASNLNLSGAYRTYTLVIPKPNATPSSGVLKIAGPVGGTFWSSIVPCPITLPSFTTNSVVGSKGAACCTATQNQTYYYAKNATFAQGSFSTPGSFNIDTNTSNLPEKNYFVYSDSNGANPLANGFYKISATQAIQVINGAVLSVSTCATCLTPYSSSVNSTSGSVCGATINQTYYHNGSLSTPVANDTVYSNQTPSFLPAGYYRTSASQYIIVGASGNVTSVNSCVTLTGFNVGNPSVFVADMCSQTAPGGNTYYHDGSGTYPVANDIVYLSNDTSSPVNGGSGIQWPYFANGATLGDSPLAYFRITGSSGTVQSVTNCP